MKARLIRYEKYPDVYGNVAEIRVWEVGSTHDKPHGYKYSLVYIVQGRRVIGYDNAEGKETTGITETGQNLTGLRAWRN